MSLLYIVVALVALQRLLELAWATRNTRRLKAQGGVEAGARHYPLFIILHASWLFAILISTPTDTPAHYGLLAFYLLLQFARLWVITTLGRFWTIRIIVMPGTPLITSGPYRFLHHPNYWIVALEVAVLPLAFGNWPVAVVWSALNVGLLGWRIRVEENANYGR